MTVGRTGAAATSDGVVRRSAAPSTRLVGAADGDCPWGGATMSSVMTPAAGAAIAATSPNARLCWHRSTNRLLFSAMRRCSWDDLGSHEHQMSHQ